MHDIVCIDLYNYPNSDKGSYPLPPALNFLAINIKNSKYISLINGYCYVNSPFGAIWHFFRSEIKKNILLPTLLFWLAMYRESLNRDQTFLLLSCSCCSIEVPRPSTHAYMYNVQHIAKELVSQ